VKPAQLRPDVVQHQLSGFAFPAFFKARSRMLCNSATMFVQLFAAAQSGLWRSDSPGAQFGFLGA
jgi:hypothetical protein